MKIVELAKALFLMDQSPDLELQEGSVLFFVRPDGSRLQVTLENGRSRPLGESWTLTACCNPACDLEGRGHGPSSRRTGSSAQENLGRLTATLRL